VHAGLDTSCCPTGEAETRPLLILTGAAQVLATLGSPAGSVVAVWLDASGKLTRPPLQRGQITAWTIAAAALAPAVLALSPLTASWPARHLADRRRLAAWDAVWCTVG
jgi:hypothetical protein